MEILGNTPDMHQEQDLCWNLQISDVVALAMLPVKREKETENDHKIP